MSDVYKSYKAPAGEGGVYLKFEDGKSVKLRLVSQPYIFYSQFKTGDPVQTKYAWAIYNHNEDKGQILQLPVTAFRKIQDLAIDDEWGDPAGYDIKITRTGTGLDTTYSIVGSPTKAELTADQKAKAEAIDVTEKVEGSIPLEQVVAGEEPPAPKPSSNASSRDDAPPIESLEPQGEVDMDELPF